ncbi:MAG: hypothetical protein SOR56_01950 [Oscillospiraceae bacterium]|nr:hypothetical protein [Oscillospiraceae bacterium]
MKKIGALNLGLTFAGCFLGAGYVSGQELWQFFGSFGKSGIIGLLLAMLLLLVVGIMMVWLGGMTQTEEIDKLVVCWNIPLLRGAVMLLELLFLFGVGTIMSAGVGALLNQLIGLPQWIGSALFAAAIALVSLAGFSGLVSVFSATVPILAIATLGFGIWSIVSHGGISFPEAKAADGSALLTAWPVSAAAFACYNLFGNVAVITPMGRLVKSRATAAGGIAVGAALLLIIAVSVLVSVGAQPSVVSAELPMLALASSMGSVFGYIYGLLLLLAMFGTALSALVAFMSMLGAKFKRVGEKRGLSTAVCVACMFAGSLFGFGDLIGIVYPIFGYCSSIFIVLMAVHFFKLKRESRVSNGNKA